MKKSFSVLALVAFVFVAFNANAQLGINFGFAPETTTSQYTISGNTTSNDNHYNGFFGGVNYNLGLTGDLHLSIGGQLRFNYHKESLTVVGVTTTSVDKQFVIDVPVLFNYGFSLGSDAKLSFMLGPVATFALTGKTTTETTVGNVKKDTDWYGDKSNLRRLDLGMAVGVSFDFKQFRLFGGYRMGLMNLTSADNTTVKTSDFFFGLGYIL